MRSELRHRCGLIKDPQWTDIIFSDITFKIVQFSETETLSEETNNAKNILWVNHL